MYVKSRAAMDAELFLHQASSRGEHHVGRGGGHDDEVDLLGTPARSFERLARGGHGEVAARHTFRGEVARANAGALNDPLVTGVDVALGQQLDHVLVRQALRRQIATGTGDA